MKFLGLFSIALTLLSSPSFAAPTTERLMISINKAAGESCSNIDVDTLDQLKDFLTYFDTTLGTQYVKAEVAQYVDYCSMKNDAPYYGIVFVNLKYTSAAKKTFYINRITQSGRYTIYSNPGVGN